MKAKPDTSTLAGQAQGDIVLLAEATTGGGFDCPVPIDLGTPVRVEWFGRHSVFISYREGSTWSRPTPISPRTKVGQVVSKRDTSAPLDAEGRGDALDPIARGSLKLDAPLLGGGAK